MKTNPDARLAVMSTLERYQNYLEVFGLLYLDKGRAFDAVFAGLNANPFFIEAVW